MNISSSITLLGISTIFMYCIIQILKFYGIGEETYGMYLLFYIFILILVLILPHEYPKV
jgi:hypothetical protein